MLTQKLKVSDVVASLTARDPEELSVFHALLYCAQFLHRRNQADMGLGKRLNDVVGFEIPDESFDPLAFIREIPAQSLRYFHGLVEALDIYQSIHGKTVPVTVDPSDAMVKELKQIRDLCIQDGLHSIY